MKPLILAFTGLSGVVLAFAWNAYPVLPNDSVFYSVPIVEVAAGHGLVNPVCMAVRQNDSQGRFIMFPPFESMVMGHVLRLFTPDAAGLFKLYGVVTVLKLALAGWLFYRRRPC